MTQIEFELIKDENGDEILLFYKYGEFNTPLMILDRFAIDKLKNKLKLSKNIFVLLSGYMKLSIIGYLN